MPMPRAPRMSAARLSPTMATPAGGRPRRPRAIRKSGGWGLPPDHGWDVAGDHGRRRDDGSASGQELSAFDRKPRVDVRGDEPSGRRRGAGGHRQPLIGEIEVVADGDDRRGPPVLEID